MDSLASSHARPEALGINHLVAGRRDLSEVERELLLGWRDPVEGIFEIRRKDGDAVVLLNLVDDLEYRAYSNVGPAAFRGVSAGGFLLTCLVPLRSAEGAWLVSGTMEHYPKSSATEIARATVQLAVSRPELVFRNPEKIEQGRQRMREDRAAFVEFCGGDELVLSAAAAEDLLNAYYRHRQEATTAAHPGRARGRRLPGPDFPAFELPPDLAETADTVFRRLLRKPGFTWAEHGEELLRGRKPWYYAQGRRRRSDSLHRWCIHFAGRFRPGSGYARFAELGLFAHNHVC
ncbi:MAG: hypothetical protein LBV60_11020 [Streptomyces sp.]|nr:hypothetical protein [Streptomyces sp.]